MKKLVIIFIIILFIGCSKKHRVYDAQYQDTVDEYAAEQVEEEGLSFEDERQGSSFGSGREGTIEESNLESENIVSNSFDPEYSAYSDDSRYSAHTENTPESEEINVNYRRSYKRKIELTANDRPAQSRTNQYYNRSYAIVIGIDDYPSSAWSNLGYAVKDAKGVANFLNSQGFEVFSLHNKKATRKNIISTIQTKIAHKLKKEDRVLIFFAGHGHTEELGDEDFGYIVPYDGTEDSATYISMDELKTLSRKMNKAKHQLFIMDACYGGMLAVVRGSKVSDNIPDYIEEITRRRARLVLTAGGKDQQVVDNGPRGHSVFTGYLLIALEEGLADFNKDGFITFSELQGYLVPAARSRYQTPAASSLPGHQGGEFVFRSPFTY